MEEAQQACFDLLEGKRSELEEFRPLGCWSVERMRTARIAKRSPFSKSHSALAPEESSATDSHVL
jgi:hypothetical protein